MMSAVSLWSLAVVGCSHWCDRPWSAWWSSVVIGRGRHRCRRPRLSWWSSVVKCRVRNCEHPHHPRQRWASSSSTRSVWGVRPMVFKDGSRLGSRSIVFDVSFLSGVMLLRASLSLPSSAVASGVAGRCPHRSRSITERGTCERAAAREKAG
jgi:hypothetical protein